MTVTLTLDRKVEASLIARARERGVSLSDYLQEIVEREVERPAPVDPRPIEERFNNLSDLLLNSPFSGAELNLERHHDLPRSIEIE